MKIIFLNSHPIQYFAPLYKEASQLLGEEKVEVWYCSKHGLNGEVDKEFTLNIKWDIPILEGYKYVFFENHSLKPGIRNGFWGLMNLGVIKKMMKLEKSLIIIHGWSHATNLITITFGKILGHKIAIRGDSSFSIEKSRSSKAKLFKKIYFSLLIPFIDYFFYIGKNNFDYYKFYGVSTKKLLFTPFAVDNQRFQKEHSDLKRYRNKIREEVGLQQDTFYVIVSGKYIEVKRPLDILEAVANLDNKEGNYGIIFMGEGKLRGIMEEYIKLKNLKNILLTGFMNQTELSKYYTIADAYVMCSDKEKWGLSTNEAMNFSLPLILYDSVGCAPDLLHDGKNGFLVQTYNINELSIAIKKVRDSMKTNSDMGNLSRNIIDNYSYLQTIQTIKALINKK